MKGKFYFQYDVDHRTAMALPVNRGPGSLFVRDWLDILADGDLLDGEKRAPYLPGDEWNCCGISWLENVFYEAFEVFEAVGDDRGSHIQMTHCRIHKLIKVQHLMSTGGCATERWDLVKLGYAISTCLLVPAMMKAQCIGLVEDLADNPNVSVNMSPEGSWVSGNDHTEALLGVFADAQQVILDQTLLALKFFRHMESSLVRAHGFEAPFRRQTIRGKTEEDLSWRSPFLSLSGNPLTGDLGGAS